MGPVLQIMPGWWLPWHRPSVAKGEALPVHGGVLEMACHHCGGRAPYRLNAYLLHAPYRCGNCGACYISLLPSQSLWRPLDHKARTAMTRKRLNC
jgi:predicted RNA-binding Zn-ribbon protein involved in translation (DUF1610 family)